MYVDWVGNRDIVGHKSLYQSTRFPRTKVWSQLTSSLERQLWLRKDTRDLLARSYDILYVPEQEKHARFGYNYRPEMTYGKVENAKLSQHEKLTILAYI